VNIHRNARLTYQPKRMLVFREGLPAGEATRVLGSVQGQPAGGSGATGKRWGTGGSSLPPTALMELAVPLRFDLAPCPASSSVRKGIGARDSTWLRSATYTIYGIVGMWKRRRSTSPPIFTEP